MVNKRRLFIFFWGALEGSCESEPQKVFGCKRLTVWEKSMRMHWIYKKEGKKEGKSAKDWENVT